MPKCVFKTDDIRRCVEHALNSTAWGMAWSQEPPQPAIFFVHDQGVYIMSNGDPRDMITTDGKERAYCAYAKDCHPDNDADFWENSRALVGGDDFVETLPITSDWLNRCDRYKELHIDMSPEAMEIAFTKPRRVVHVR